MDYETACETIITREQAKREIERHQCEGWDAFLADCGDHNEYMGETVLTWLGY